jgi:hypothetical protein
MTKGSHEDISTVKVDVDLDDPNIRGGTGSIRAAASEEQLKEMYDNIKNGMSRSDAEQNLAVIISRNAQRVIGATQEYDTGFRPTVRGAVERIAPMSRTVISTTRESDVKTITIMCKDYACLGGFDSPRSTVKKVKTWIYSTLSLAGGMSPLHYWSAYYAVMEDFWTQDDLDQYASFHGASGVARLELDTDAADALIAEIRCKAIDHSPTKSMLDHT